MSEGDRAAVHVRLGRIEAELFADGERLRAERFVHLDQVDVVEREFVLGQYVANGGHWADAHHFRIDADHVVADEARQRRQVLLLHRLLVGEYDRSGAVAYATCITCQQQQQNK